MFTKKHYKAIAEIIENRAGINNYVYAEERTHALSIANDLADYFAKNNPRFDKDKFLEACGL